jgi:hypothetical protein
MHMQTSQVKLQIQVSLVTQMKSKMIEKLEKISIL